MGRETYKTYNGKRYKLRAACEYKRTANTNKKILQSRGYYVRILDEKIAGRHTYLVYARKK